MILSARAFSQSHRTWLLILLTLFGAMLMRNCQKQTPTTDEHVHLVRGLAFIKLEPTLLRGHPPLFNALQALSAASDDALELSRVKDDARVSSVASALFKKHPKKMRHHIVFGRTITALFALLFMALLFEHLRKRFGLKSAGFACALFALHPSVLAHAQLCTTDFSFAALALLTLCALTELFETQNRRALLKLCFWSSALVCTKYVGILFALFLLVVGIAWALFAKNVRYAGAAGMPEKNKLARFIKDAALVLCCALFAFMAVHLFDAPFKTAQGLAAEQPALVAGSSLSALGNVPLPFARTALFGLAEAERHHTRGHSSYFDKEVSSKGWPGFYAALFFAKTPLALLVLSFVSLFALVRFRERRRLLLLGVSAAACFVFYSMSSIQIGYRHVLLFVLAHAALVGVLSGSLVSDDRFSLKNAAFFAALLSLFFGAYVAPDYLGDFNLCFDYLKDATPVNTINDHIEVYLYKPKILKPKPAPKPALKKVRTPLKAKAGAQK